MHRRFRLISRARALAALLLLVVPTTMWTATAPASAANTVTCPTGYNPVACENLQPGTPFADWYAPNAWGAIQGFTTQESVQPGETVSLKVQSPSTYKVDVYRLGWYQGNGARLMSWTPTATYPANNSGNPAACLTKNTGLVDCGNWPTTVTFTVPSDAVSGLYIAGLDQTDGNGYMPYPFVVRNDSSHSAVVVQTSDETWQAYNTYGGQNLYDGSGPAPDGRAYEVSYNRPFGSGGANGIFGSEYSMIAWLERNGYDVSYISGLDTSTRPADVSNHKIFISDGHDEYWNQPQWDNVMAARKSGTSLAFFSGNEVFWRTRLAPSIDAGAEANRTLVCYKMTKLEFSPPDGIADPSGQWTGTWMDPAGQSAGGYNPENSLTGSIFQVNAYQSSAITVPSTYSAMRLWRNTAVAKLAAGQTYSFQTGTLGYEWDSDLPNASRPNGEIDLSSTTLSVDQLRLDYGNNYGNGTATHSLVEYRDPTSHALTFGTGTVQWSWGLNTVHSDAATNEDPNMQQATVNVLADMGVQPQTEQTNLVAATQSTDTVGPNTTISAPAAGATVPVLRPVTISGTAADVGGGIVARTEVSTDGGATWNPATGLTSWTYSWTPTQQGTQTIQVRAVDDSVNIGPVTSRSVTVGPQQCPCSVWPAAAAPTRVDGGDGSSVELGTKFQVTQPGNITGVKFYKSSLNTGTHTGSLWSPTGQLLATGTFSNETASGWQTLSFSSPVPVRAGATYTVSYHAPNGHYSADAGYFTSSGAGLAPIQANQSASGAPNGVYNYGSGMPVNGYQDTNYWVDAIFDASSAPSNPPTVTSTTPADGATGVSITAPLSAVFSQGIDTSTLQFTVKDSAGNSAPGTVTYTAATNTATFTPTGQLGLSTAYTATVQASDLWGNAMTAPKTWSFTTSSTPPNTNCPCSLWSSSQAPTTADSGDANSLELGTRFTSAVSGNVTGVKFYKSAANTGTHTGSLWSSTGTLLATGTFTNETASGWQTLSFSSPVAITANTVYVVSYHTTTGHYAADGGYFSGAYTNYPLTALASNNGGNGMYAYGTGPLFPNGTYNSTNYWVDAVFTATSGGGTAAVTSQATATPAALPLDSFLTRAANAGQDPVMDATHPITTVLPPGTDPSSVKMTVTTAAPVQGQEWQTGTVMPGSVSYDAATRTVSFRPNVPLIRSGSYKVEVTANGKASVAETPIVWNIHPTSDNLPHSPAQAPGVPPVAMPSSAHDGRKRVLTA